MNKPAEFVITEQKTGNNAQAVLKICHTLKSHFSARSMAIYLLRKKLPTAPDAEQQQDIAEILGVLDTSLQKELELVQQLEQLVMEPAAAEEGP